MLADPAQLRRWSFGTWEAVVSADGLIEGRAIFDGSVSFVRVDSDARRGTIHYLIGPDRQALQPRIVFHVVPGDRLGRSAAGCVLTMLAWRAAGMDDERWRRLTAGHEFEAVLIKALLENPGAALR